ncbi:MAG: hypothetical protein SGILL_005343, partial [Bacillariaceae sp.]
GQNDKSSDADANAGVVVSFEKLSYSVNVGKKEGTLAILDNLSGSFVPGKLTALMGPSGSGKSTLLDILAGRKTSGAIEGELLIGGKAPTLDDVRYSLGYVEQFDTLHDANVNVPALRLRYTAELKLPSNVSAEERQARVEEVINMLDLESCRHTVIGSPLARGISGGQAKRVNIGLALLQKPPIVLLDEPTSGLDSRVADEVVELLRELAHTENRTIVCTIHSPTGHAFSCFDSLYMIHNGHTIYDGPVAKVQSYFENHGYERDADASLPEWLVDMTSDLQSVRNRRSAITTGDEVSSRKSLPRTDTQSSSFIELFESSEVKRAADVSRKELSKLSQDEGANTPAEKAKQQFPSEFSKLVTLLKYRMLAHYKDGEFLGTRFGDKIIYALLILSLYFGLGEQSDPQSIASISSLLFFISALCGFGAAAFVPTLNLERKLFYRELSDGCYSPATYYFSKFIEEAVIAVFTSALFSAIVFFGVKFTGNFGIFFVNYYLTTLSEYTWEMRCCSKSSCTNP